MLLELYDLEKWPTYRSKHVALSDKENLLSVLYILFSSCQLAFSDYPDLRFFPCFFPSFKVNARVSLAKTWRGPHSSILVNCVVLFIVSIVLFYVLFVCKCVLYYLHRVATQLQLNIPYHISYIVGLSYTYFVYYIETVYSTTDGVTCTKSLV